MIIDFNRVLPLRGALFTEVKLLIQGFISEDKKWLCPSCKQASEESDHVYNYTVAKMWYGLLDRCQRDGIRENDGKFMLLMWRVNMLRFWADNHNKYMILAHRLITG